MDNNVSRRFWGKVKKVEGGCWNWTADSVNGYGRFWLDGRLVLAHRYAYESLVGDIPKGLETDHLCRNPACVNPEHLEMVTHKEDHRRGLAGIVAGHRQLAKTHCPQGHPYDEKNTYIHSNGARECRICGKKHRQEWRVMKRNENRILGGYDRP